MIKRLKKYTHYEKQKGVEKMLNKMDEKIKLWVLRANLDESLKGNGAFDRLFDDISENKLNDELKRLDELDKKGKISTNEVLEKNLKYLSLVMGLNDDEQKILEFLICLKSISVLNDIFRDCVVNSFSCFAKIAIILALSEESVKKALAHNSKFEQSNIFELFRDERNFGLNEVCQIYNDFAFIMFENSSLERMSDGKIRQIDSTEPKITKNVDEILALIAKKPNANILVKDKEICKKVANRLGARLFELVYRLEACFVRDKRDKTLFNANAFLESKNSILMIDEIDDIFNDKTPKALIKRILSENVLPTFWVSDECDFTKYFDMVVD